jgi:hypothetical protein
VSASNFSRAGIAFVGQFACSQRTDALPDGGRTESLRGWTLARCASLPARNVVDAAGAHVGWLLGWPIDADGLCSPAALTVPALAGIPSFSGTLESTVSRLAGRFAVIVLSDGLRRVYLDPCGQLGVVYNSAERTIASSLILAVREPAPARPLAAAMNIPAQDNWYPFGLTPDRHVRRLLPNHFLDLHSFETCRHWRGDEARGAGSDIDALVAAIASRLRSNVESLAREQPLLIPLTAGRDSRMLLAAARRVLDRTAFFTTELPDDTARRDCRVARRSARRFGLCHAVLDWQTPSGAELEEWQVRTGRCVAGRTWREVRTRRQCDSTRLVLPGLCGEIGRSYYWRRGDAAADGLSADALLQRLRLPHAEPLVENAAAWLRDFTGANVADTVDHAYIEQRLGCWAGPSHYGHVHNACTLPLSDRAIVSATLRLPYAYRAARSLAADVVRLLWPELLRIPFNRDAALVHWPLTAMSRLRRWASA